MDGWRQVSFAKDLRLQLVGSPGCEGAQPGDSREFGKSQKAWFEMRGEEGDEPKEVGGYVVDWRSNA
jgi:hypothetical protein